MDISTVTTQDLIATIQNDHDDIVTFEARSEYRRRCNSDWRVFAPAKPRTYVSMKNSECASPIYWHNFGG
jgi:hypothetical protein